MNEKKKQEVQEKPNSAIAPRISGDNNVPAGQEGIDINRDIKMPRLAILQGLSEIVTSGQGRMGQLANSLTQEVLGDEVEFIPLFKFETRVQFEPGKGVAMMSRDGRTVTMANEGFEQYLGKSVDEVPGAQWSGNEPPKFSEVYNFPIVIVGRDSEFPLSLSLMKTAIKAAQNLCSLIIFSGEDTFARVYSIKTESTKNEKGTFAIPNIKFVRRCTDGEYERAKNWYTMLHKRRQDIDIDLTDENQATTPPDSGSGEEVSPDQKNWEE